MAQANRTVILRRLNGAFRLVLGSSLLLVTGCYTCDHSEYPLSESDLYSACSMAYFSQGLLIQNNQHQNTNANYRVAEASLRTALLFDPRNREAVIALAGNLYKQKRADDVYPLLANYLTYVPHDEELQLEAIRLLSRTNGYARAKSHAQQLYQRAPDNFDYQVLTVELSFLSGDISDGIRLLKKSRSPELAYQFLIAYLQRNAGPDLLLALAELVCDMAPPGTPVYRTALLIAANQYQQKNNYADAVERYLTLAHFDPQDTLSLRSLGEVIQAAPCYTAEIEEQLHDIPGVFSFVRAASMIAATNAVPVPDAVFPLLKDYEHARLRAGYFPAELYYLWAAGLYLESTRNDDELDAFIQNALVVHPASNPLKNTLAYAWSIRGKNLPQALALINQVLAEPKEAENPAYIDTKGWILFKMGRNYEALQLILKAAERDNREPEILNHLGDVLLAVGRQSEAVEAWKKSVAIKPDAAIEEKIKRLAPTTVK